MVSLAWPVILAEIGWVLMGVVDTIFVGPLGPAVIGGVGIGSTLFFAIMVFGSGLFFALDTFVAQSFGAGRMPECHRWLFAALELAVVLSVVFVGVGYAGVTLAALLRHSSGRAGRVAAISGGAALVGAAAVPVHGVPALPASHEHRPAHSRRRRGHESRERVRQLGLRVWPSGDAGDGRGRFRLRDGRRAHRARHLSCGSSSFVANGGVRRAFTTRR